MVINSIGTSLAQRGGKSHTRRIGLPHRLLEPENRTVVQLRPIWNGEMTLKPAYGGIEPAPLLDRNRVGVDQVVCDLKNAAFLVAVTVASWLMNRTNMTMSVHK